MKLALVLNAINPRLGGVLIRGQKGTAKSTAARGLAGLLPPVDVVVGCRFGCSPGAADVQCPDCAGLGNPTDSVSRAAEFVELPIGATEDRVLGTLDMERALVDGRRHFEPGLLARANRGVLYVDEVNLLPDHLVDTLLDAAAMGVNTVERDGVSFSHPAAFVLVGTMNPEEGELRPQLLDRFALAVDVAGMLATSERVEVVRRRIAFEADPAGFVARWEAAECMAQARIMAARAVLPRVTAGDDLLELIARICTAFEVDGLRADIVMYKTATTLAAYAGREQVSTEDVRRAAELALPHRTRRQPFDQPGLDHQRLDEIVAQHDNRPRRDSPPTESSTDGNGTPPHPPPQDGGHDRPTDPPPQHGGHDRPTGPPPWDGGDRGPRRDEPRGGPGGGVRLEDDGSLHPQQAEQVFDTATVAPPALPLRPPAAQRRGWPTRASTRGVRSPVESPRGRHVRSSPEKSGALDLLATLRSAAPFQAQRRRSTPEDQSVRIQLKAVDLRYKVRVLPVGALTVFVVDASGSMAARRRMALAKGAVQSLLLRAYQTRDEVALIAFRGSAAEILLPPTSSVHLASVRLRALPTGGRTPLALALSRAAALLAQRAATRHPWAAPQASPARQRAAIQTLVLVSDGRANVALAGGDPYADALHQARALRAAGVQAVVVDSEEGHVRLGRARTLASELGAEYVRLADLTP